MDISLTQKRMQAGVKLSADVDSWREFVRFYSPVIYGYARKRGFRDADASRLMQKVLQTVARSDDAIEYNLRGGSTLGRLYTLTCHALSTHQNRTGKTSDINSLSKAIANQSVEPDSDWDLAYQRRLVTKAMDGIKAAFDQQIWQAFWKTTVEGRSAQDAAMELEMTLGAVCVARCRVLSRLKKEMQR